MRPGAAFTTSRAARGALALAVGALVALPGCGGGGNKGGPIPVGQSARLLALLQLADQEAGNGRCGGADAKVREAQSVLAGLPRSVDSDVRQGLAEGFDRLRSLIGSQCRRPAPTTSTTTSSTTTSSTTTPTTTTPTSTTSSSTTTTTPTTTTTTTTTTTASGNGGVPPPPAGNGQ